MTHLTGILDKEYGTKSPITLKMMRRRARFSYGCRRLDEHTLQQVWSSVPYIPNLNKKILRIITRRPSSFNMNYWHSQKDLIGGYADISVKPSRVTRECGTAHCMAGWACVLAGRRGSDLEHKLGPEVAGTLIFAKSTGHVPYFFGPSEDALQALKYKVSMERLAEGKPAKKITKKKKKK